MFIPKMWICGAKDCDERERKRMIDRHSHVERGEREREREGGGGGGGGGGGVVKDLRHWTLIQTTHSKFFWNYVALCLCALISATNGSSMQSVVFFFFFFFFFCGWGVVITQMNMNISMSQHNVQQATTSWKSFTFLFYRPS